MTNDEWKIQDLPCHNHLGRNRSKKDGGSKWRAKEKRRRGKYMESVPWGKCSERWTRKYVHL